MSGPGIPLLFALLLGCPPPYQPKKLEMESIGTTKDVPTTTLDDPGDGGVVAPNSGTPSPGSSGGVNTLCSGSEFEDLADALRSCEVPMPKASEVGSMRDKVEVKVTASTSTTSPGGRIDLQITLRNKSSSDPVTVYFTGDPYPRFDVEATDSRGRRADLPDKRWPGYPKGMKPEARETKASRVTLDKNGTAKVKISWDAVRTKWAPDKARSWEGRGYPRVPSGPLPKGKYSLKLILPIFGDVEVPKVPVEVS
ncbi:MAG: hypothetical protein KIT84_20855 [Labilithrix sp.]|nr:hypothetical protein [Labilithrix sp.]MCW5813492.1 hypothetical protein [Labilithrix sp.]